MPELPEVETIRSQLERLTQGKKIVKVRLISDKPLKNSSPVDFVKSVENKTITAIKRRAKILIIELFGGLNLLVHLKMTGRLLYAKPDEEVAKHTHIIFSLSDGMELSFWDMRQFGYVKLAEGPLGDAQEIKDLGPEALDISDEEFRRIVKAKKSGKIKPLLMDQNFLAGVGNIYSDEALFLAGIDPLRSVSSLTGEEIKNLASAIRHVLADALKAGGSSVGDYVDVFGREGSYVKQHRVYGRAGKDCPCCGGSIGRIKLGGRSAHFCPICQK
ncbi:MAG: bifunctional DNA-formamidopyrimidine glycosylase/DNA-(apurinic or apyrimidinic site) lyase [Actinomycetota bacterium]|nr:bifunctional DNA-formamidopyrimidine glycosylase/DNA-(apurinic or apyrimidinic site) lyase [Actinomycetota bacterium]